MAAISGSPNVFFRIMIAGLTSMLIMSTMSLAVRFVAGIPEDASITGGVLGNIVQPGPGSFYSLYNMAVILIGLVTFFGSFMMMSGKKTS